MFAPEQRFSDTMPVVDMACMCFTELDTSSVQVDVRSSMVCLLMRAGPIFDVGLPFFEEASDAGVSQGVAVGTLAGVSCRLAAPASVRKGPAHWWLEFADLVVERLRDRRVVAVSYTHLTLPTSV